MFSSVSKLSISLHDRVGPTLPPAALYHPQPLLVHRLEMEAFFLMYSSHFDMHRSWLRDVRVLQLDEAYGELSPKVNQLLLSMPQLREIQIDDLPHTGWRTGPPEPLRELLSPFVTRDAHRGSNRLTTCSSQLTSHTVLDFELHECRLSLRQVTTKVSGAILLAAF